MKNHARYPQQYGEPTTPLSYDPDYTNLLADSGDSANIGLAAELDFNFETGE